MGASTHRCPSRALRRRQAGFSLLEMMVAVLILAVITSQLFVVLSTQKRAYVSEVRDLDLQESARVVADMMAFDARNAGMMVPREAAVASFNNTPGGGPDAGTDRFCASAGDYFNVGPAWDTLTDRFPGIQVNGFANDKLTLAGLDVDGPTLNPGGAADNDFLPLPRGVIVATVDGTASHCDTVQAINGTELTLADGIPAGWPGGPSIAVPAVVYRVAPDPLNAARPVLLRDGLQISTLIEDLQVEYWVDSGPGANNIPDGVPDANDFPIHQLMGLAPPQTLPPPGGSWTSLSRIRNIRISVLAAGDVQDVDSQQTARFRRPAIADRPAAAVPDTFERRLYVVNVLPRNLLAPGVVFDGAGLDVE